MSSDIFTKLAATMRHAWQGRPMSPAVVAFVKRIDSSGSMDLRNELDAVIVRALGTYFTVAMSLIGP